MSAALPVLFDCVPYHARITKQTCADRWRRAKAPAKKHGNDAGMSYGDRLSHEKCLGCPVGEKHAAELEPRESSRPRRRAPTKPVIASPAAAPVPNIPIIPKEVSPMVRRCSECGNKNKRLPVDGVCRKCRGGGAPSSRRVKSAKVEERPALLVFLELHSKVEELRRRHEEEVEAALEEIASFEAEHPDVRDSAKVVLERIAGRPTGKKAA